MNLAQKKITNQSGSMVIMLVIMTLMVISIIGVMMMDTSQVEVEVAGNDLRVKKNLYIAESGAYGITRAISAVADDEEAKRGIMTSNMTYETSLSDFRQQLRRTDVYTDNPDVKIRFLNGTALVDVKLLSLTGLRNASKDWDQGGPGGSGSSTGGKISKKYRIRSKGYMDEGGTFCIECEYVKYLQYNRGF